MISVVSFIPSFLLTNFYNLFILDKCTLYNCLRAFNTCINTENDDFFITFIYNRDYYTNIKVFI
jgi:hypothetical protein